MRTNQILKAATVATGLALMPARAFAFDWAACNKDIKKSCPKATGDDAIFECLEKVEKKLSKPCYEAHEKFEKEKGKADKDKDEDKK